MGRQLLLLCGSLGLARTHVQSLWRREPRRSQWERGYAPDERDAFVFALRGSCSAYSLLNPLLNP